MFTTGDVRSGDPASSESPSKMKAPTTVEDFQIYKKLGKSVEKEF